MNLQQSSVPPGEIEIRVGSVGQIFNSFDPSPFHERDLDSAAEEFVIDWAREIPRDLPITIKLCLPSAATQGPEARRAPQAIANYFAGRAQATRREMREYFRVGRRYLVVGLLILAVCLSLSAVIPEGPFAETLREGLIIVGWVANWRPIEVFLYDWQPIRRKRKLYERLATAKIEIEPA